MKSFYYLLLLFSIIACNSESTETYKEIDMRGFQLPADLQLEALITEPQIESPVNISFDDFGNLWTLEMPGYMANIEGINEDAPVGKIQVFFDRNGDGVIDDHKVVKDQMILARAFAHVYGGLLYAEPPHLYFAEISEDFQLINTVIVDSLYVVGGNLEHQPNGLIMNIDNWIYSAKSSKRYRRHQGKWEIERTGFRGQWGISHDPYGRLLYNDNSNPLRGDIGIPGLLSQNPNYKASKSFNHVILKDRRVFPVQATAVNRGYIENILDKEGKLVHFTSACSPLYFEGRQLAPTYRRDVYVCAPEVNLIKRIDVKDKDLDNQGTQVYKNDEFLISTDEGFRPVNIQNGPDGAMYIVDMHKGMIQYKTYMTKYLRDQYIEKGLDKISGMGRIFRLTGLDQKPYSIVDLTKITTTDLIDSLGSRNMWIRDRAQQLIIQRNDKRVFGKLVSFLKSVTKETNRIQILYIMDALGILQDFHLKIYPNEERVIFLSHLIKLSKEYEVEIKDNIIEQLIARNEDWLDYHLIYYLANKRSKNKSYFLKSLIEKHTDKKYFMEPLYAGMEGNESYIKKYLYDQNEVLDQINTIQKHGAYPLHQESYKDGLTNGRVLYNTHCGSCHDPGGTGLEGLGPPLLGSKYIKASTDHLVSIIVYGLKGPVTVNGITYDDGVAMPGLGGNEALSDADIKDIANYARNAFTNSEQSINVSQVRKIRTMDRAKDKMYTSKELYESYPID